MRFRAGRRAHHSLPSQGVARVDNQPRRRRGESVGVVGGGGVSDAPLPAAVAGAREGGGCPRGRGGEGRGGEGGEMGTAPANFMLAPPRQTGWLVQPGPGPASSIIARILPTDRTAPCRSNVNFTTRLSPSPSPTRPRSSVCSLHLVHLLSCFFRVSPPHSRHREPAQ